MRRAWSRRLAAVALAFGFALAGGLASTQAAAQQVNRFIPPEAKRGVVKHVESMIVSIDGNQVSLAPGSNIRDTNNFLIVPTALPTNGAVADYMLDGNGQVRRLWLLTREEAERPKPPKR